MQSSAPGGQVWKGLAIVAGFAVLVAVAMVATAVLHGRSENAKRRSQAVAYLEAIRDGSWIGGHLDGVCPDHRVDPEALGVLTTPKASVTVGDFKVRNGRPSVEGNRDRFGGSVTAVVDPPGATVVVSWSKVSTIGSSLCITGVTTE